MAYGSGNGEVTAEFMVVLMALNRIAKKVISSFLPDESQNSTDQLSLS